MTARRQRPTTDCDVYYGLLLTALKQYGPVELPYQYLACGEIEVIELQPADKLPPEFEDDIKIILRYVGPGEIIRKQVRAANAADGSPHD